MTDVRFFGKENSDKKGNLKIEASVGDQVGASATTSVRTWVLGFRRVAVTPNQGSLIFLYGWHSESGKPQTPFLDDLDDSIKIGEVVRYPTPLPNPPFVKPPPNPTVIVGNAAEGKFTDVNGYKSPIGNPEPPFFAKPYSKLDNVAKQKIGFWDLVWEPGEAPTPDNPREDAMHSLKEYDVVREILETPWRFRIKKDGYESETPLPP